MPTTHYTIKVNGRIHTTTLSKVHAIGTARRLRDVEGLPNVRLFAKQVQTDTPLPCKGSAGSRSVSPYSAAARFAYNRIA
ncbi:MAG: hypothetical protein GY832_20235 [Chloroflexi bacterium]|nr:hypothetical protein [Chloroflexota bacterium]